MKCANTLTESLTRRIELTDLSLTELREYALSIGASSIMRIGRREPLRLAIRRYETSARWGDLSEVIRHRIGREDG